MSSQRSWAGRNVVLEQAEGVEGGGGRPGAGGSSRSRSRRREQEVAEEGLDQTVRSCCSGKGRKFQSREAPRPKIVPIYINILKNPSILYRRFLLIHPSPDTNRRM